MPGPSEEAVRRVLEQRGQQPASQPQADGLGVGDMVDGALEGADLLFDMPDMLELVVDGASAVVEGVGGILGAIAEGIGGLG